MSTKPKFYSASSRARVQALQGARRTPPSSTYPCRCTACFALHQVRLSTGGDRFADQLTDIPCGKCGAFALSLGGRGR
jgi:hypothetical protein